MARLSARNRRRVQVGGTSELVIPGPYFSHEEAKAAGVEFKKPFFLKQNNEGGMYKWVVAVQAIPMILLFLLAGSTDLMAQRPWKGSGWCYFAENPNDNGYEPDTTFACEWAWDFVNKEAYYYDRDSVKWINWKPGELAIDTDLDSLNLIPSISSNTLTIEIEGFENGNSVSASGSVDLPEGDDDITEVHKYRNGRFEITEVLEGDTIKSDSLQQFGSLQYVGYSISGSDTLGNLIRYISSDSVVYDITVPFGPSSGGQVADTDIDSLRLGGSVSGNILTVTVASRESGNVLFSSANYTLPTFTDSNTQASVISPDNSISITQGTNAEGEIEYQLTVDLFDIDTSGLVELIKQYDTDTNTQNDITSFTQSLSGTILSTRIITSGGFDQIRSTDLAAFLDDTNTQSSVTSSDGTVEIVVGTNAEGESEYDLSITRDGIDTVGLADFIRQFDTVDPDTDISSMEISFVNYVDGVLPYPDPPGGRNPDFSYPIIMSARVIAITEDEKTFTDTIYDYTRLDILEYEIDGNGDTLSVTLQLLNEAASSRDLVKILFPNQVSDLIDSDSNVDSIWITQENAAGAPLILNIREDGNIISLEINYDARLTDGFAQTEKTNQTFLNFTNLRGEVENITIESGRLHQLGIDGSILNVAVGEDTMNVEIPQYEDLDIWQSDTNGIWNDSSAISMGRNFTAVGTFYTEFDSYFMNGDWTDFNIRSNLSQAFMRWRLGSDEKLQFQISNSTQVIKSDSIFTIQAGILFPDQILNFQAETIQFGIGQDVGGFPGIIGEMFIEQGNINMTSNYVNNVLTPTQDHQAVNKGYVDSLQTSFSITPFNSSAISGNLEPITFTGGSASAGALSNTHLIPLLSTDSDGPLHVKFVNASFTVDNGTTVRTFPISMWSQYNIDVYIENQTLYVNYTGSDRVSRYHINLQYYRP